MNSTMRRQRRRLAMLAVVLGIAGATVVAHSAMGEHQMGDALVVCLAVAETAVVAVGATLALGAGMQRPLWLIAAPAERRSRFIPALPSVRARAGPPLLQVFRR